MNDSALHALMRYRWPGNLRELGNVIQQAVIRCKGHTIGRRHLPPHIVEPSDLVPIGGFASLADIERQHIKASSSRSAATRAKLLGIHRNTLANKMRKYGLEG